MIELIEERELVVLFPNFDRFRTLYPDAGMVSGNEVSLILRMGQAIQAKHVLEIGTNRGGFTKILAENFNQIISIDAPIEELTQEVQQDQLGELLSLEEIGQEVRHLKNVELLFGSSRSRKIWETLHPTFFSSFDLVFIDGNHSFQGVINDFLLSLPLLKIGGVIIFHDVKLVGNEEYGPLKALKILPVRFYWIKNTWLAFWMSERR